MGRESWSVAAARCRSRHCAAAIPISRRKARNSDRRVPNGTPGDQVSFGFGLKRRTDATYAPSIRNSEMTVNCPLKDANGDGNPNPSTGDHCAFTQGQFVRTGTRRDASFTVGKRYMSVKLLPLAGCYHHNP
jgi:hypothetical protein